MKKGLVFCGGGSKGAYQMGCWKALEELGEKFDIVAGTSIGCLNAAMYTQNDYERCLHLWNTITIDQIMVEDLTLDEKSIRTSLKKKQDFIPLLKKYVQDFGVDIKPFLALMDDYCDVEKLKNSNVDFGIVTAQFPSFKPCEVRVKDIPDEDVKKYILASCSCFPVFPVCKIGDKRYVDGGYYDNLPINFALKMGAEEIVALDLSVDGTHKEFIKMPYVKYIKPFWPLGSFMRFDQNIIEENLTMGYNDTMKAYGKYLGFRFTFKKFADVYFARAFVIYLAKMVGLMRLKKVKTNVRPEREGDIFCLLEKYTYRPLSDVEYYLRAMEYAGELFNINHIQVYEVNNFMSQIISNVESIEFDEGILEGYTRFKSSSKQKDFLSSVDDKLLFRYLYYQLENNNVINEQMLLNVMGSKPIVFIVYALLKIRSE